MDLELVKIVKRINDLGYDIHISQEAKKFLANKGYDIQFGARPLKRAIQNYVEDEISELLLDNAINEGNKIIVDHTADSEKLQFTIQED